MTAKIEPPKFHLTTCHDNNSMILQFVLFELLKAFEELYKIEHSISEVKLTPTNKLSKSDRVHLHSIASSLAKLMGNTSKNVRITAWTINDGVLAKLKNYCSYFANNLDPDSANGAALLRISDQAWTIGLESLELNRTAQQVPSRGSPNVLGLKTTFERLKTKLLRLAKVVANICTEFHEDENVLFFLLRHREELDRAIKKGFVSKLFSQMFPNGLKKVERILKKKYSSRGFEHLIPVITQKLSELDMAQQ
ncbi:MAG: hypothetical protein K940chlam7_00215 [Chlamydiae bacterium]|nr:hypothetical protein [Chlamydiota bacterium]